MPVSSLAAPGRHELSPEELRARREAAGLSTYGLAELLGVSPGSVKHWEAGRKPVPRGRLSELLSVLASHAAVVVPAMTGRELRKLRKRAQLNQSDVAHLLGVSQPAVKHWEAGEVPEARRDVLRQALAGDVAPEAAVVRALRERAGWKQAELAERVGAKQSEVSKWERGIKPIEPERFTQLRDVLLAAEPSARPAQSQQPVTAEELRAGLRRLDWTQHDLANALGVSRGTVGPWSSGAKRIPPERWAQIRAVLGTAAPAPANTPRDRVADALQLVLYVIEGEPGLGRTDVIGRVDAPEPHARAAIVRALERDLVHERRVPRQRRDDVTRLMPGLFPGPLPAQLPAEPDLVELVLPEAIAAIAAEPGRTRRQVAEALAHGRRLGEHAIARALDAGDVHERAVLVRHSRSPRGVLGLFPGPAPPLPAPITGAMLRLVRVRVVLGQAELAELLDVGAPVLARWEASQVPDAWRAAVADALRHVADAYAARAAERRRRIVEAVQAEPGRKRWGMARLVRHVERPLLGEVLDGLVAAGELHERPVDGGVGLFAGPPPAEWEPGEPLSATELRAMRTWAGLPQRELAERIGAGVASVNAWEQGTQPVPAYRRAQLRRELAERRPPEPAPLPGDQLRAARRRLGWSQTELANKVGVRQAAVSKWERGAVPVPAPLRDELRELLTAPAPQVALFGDA